MAAERSSSITAQVARNGARDTSTPWIEDRSDDDGERQGEVQTPVGGVVEARQDGTDVAGGEAVLEVLLARVGEPTIGES